MLDGQNLYRIFWSELKFGLLMKTEGEEHQQFKKKLVQQSRIFFVQQNDIKIHYRKLEL